MEHLEMFRSHEIISFLGPLMFGGSPSYSASSSSASGQIKARNQRVLLSGSPYHCAAASRIAAKQQGRQRPSHSSSTTPSPSGKFWNQILLYRIYKNKNSFSLNRCILPYFSRRLIY